MLRPLWIVCLAATLWFALAPPSMGGLGGEGYHGLAFLVLGLMTPAAFPRLPLIVVWIVLAALGGSIELAQQFLPLVDRHGEWADLRINVYASTVSILVVWLMRKVFSRWPAGKETG